MFGMTRAATLLLLCSIIGVHHTIATRDLLASPSESASDTSGLDVDDYCPFNSADSEQSSGTTKLYVKKLYTCIKPGTGQANKALVPNDAGAITLPGNTNVKGVLTFTARSFTQTITQASFSTPTHTLTVNSAPSCVDSDGHDQCDAKFGTEFVVVNGNNNAAAATFSMNFEFREMGGRVFFSWDQWMYLVDPSWPTDTTNGPTTSGTLMMVVGTISNASLRPKRQIRCLGTQQDNDQSGGSITPLAGNVFSAQPDDYNGASLVTIHTDGTVTLTMGTDSTSPVFRVTLESCSWDI